jgi:septal ring factor EnvC (AmiA/AmiB activator)
MTINYHGLLPTTNSVLLCCMFICSVFAPQVDAEDAAAIDAAQVQSQLDALNAKIEEHKKLLENTRDQRSTIETELMQNETEIDKLIRRIEKIESELKQGEKKIKQLRVEKKELDQAKIEQQGYIKEQIRAAYAIGTQEHLKLLLNQEDPAEISRMLTYYDSFNRARADQVNRYRELLNSLARIEANIVKQTNLLANTRNQLQYQHDKLSLSKEKRQLTLAMLKATLLDKEAKLAKLVADRRGLESLLERLVQSIGPFPAIDELGSFADQKGKIMLPVGGKITNRFGSSRNAGKLRWQGVFIKAEEGEPIHAVHHGRVVFSDWLRGFGMLLIINHGDGYMSLYGHNQALYRQTGDWVAANEVIALSGNSGGLDRSGLYFEIRQSGKPRDPQSWCLARV